MVVNLFKKSFFKLVLSSFVVVLLMVSFMWLQFSHPQQFHSITTIFAQHPTRLTVLRWSLIALFAGSWPYFIRKYAKKHDWQEEKIQFWLTQRFRLSVWLIIFELLVCENILINLIKAI